MMNFLSKKIKEIEPNVDALFALFHLMVSPLYFIMWLGLLLLIQKNFTSAIFSIGGLEEYIISGGIATMIFGKRKILALSVKKPRPSGRGYKAKHLTFSQNHINC